MKSPLPLASLLAATALALPMVGVADDLPFHRDRHTRAGVELGIHLSSYPELVIIPGMPVYYDPRIIANYFFYEGTFWVFEDDDWYCSDWYNGPWTRVSRDEVPVFLLRIPVRYFHRPPLYFRPWALEMPPRWALRWGREWERRHRGWDRWDRRQPPPPPSPLPFYQRDFPRERYPYAPEVQQRLRREHYRYRPREPLNVPVNPPVNPPLNPPLNPPMNPPARVPVRPAVPQALPPIQPLPPQPPQTQPHPMPPHPMPPHPMQHPPAPAPPPPRSS